MPDDTPVTPSRRDFLVRSATLSGAAFLSIALPPALGTRDAQAALATPPTHPPSGSR
ncbi:MAG: twin-arginine translocation signal domain-containing protein [Betaproteobacteria bacterium]|nr:twin-arginine translocation signal domain-containing protein [Betaproteobacteria bacterium]